MPHAAGGVGLVCVRTHARPTSVWGCRGRWECPGGCQSVSSAAHGRGRGRGTGRWPAPPPSLRDARNARVPGSVCVWHGLCRALGGGGRGCGRGCAGQRRVPLGGSTEHAPDRPHRRAHRPTPTRTLDTPAPTPSVQHHQRTDPHTSGGARRRALERRPCPGLPLGALEGLPRLASAEGEAVCRRTRRRAWPLWPPPTGHWACGGGDGVWL